MSICGGQPKDQVAARCPVERPLLMILRPLRRVAVHRAEAGSQRPAAFGRDHGRGLPSCSPTNGRTGRDQPFARTRLEIDYASTPGVTMGMMRGWRSLDSVR